MWTTRLVTHAFLFVYQPMSRRERPFLLHFCTRELHGIRARASNSPGVGIEPLFHERARPRVSTFMNAFHKSCRVSFDRACILCDDVNVHVINCIRLVCETINGFTSTNNYTSGLEPSSLNICIGIIRCLNDTDVNTFNF